jgi:hypothetical protein
LFAAAQISVGLPSLRRRSRFFADFRSGRRLRSLLGLRARRPRRGQRFQLGLVTISSKECASYLSARQVFSVWVARRVAAGDFSLLILVDSGSRS